MPTVVSLQQAWQAGLRVSGPGGSVDDAAHHGLEVERTPLQAAVAAGSWVVVGAAGKAGSFGLASVRQEHSGSSGTADPVLVPSSCGDWRQAAAAVLLLLAGGSGCSLEAGAQEGEVACWPEFVAG